MPTKTSQPTPTEPHGNAIRVTLLGPFELLATGDVPRARMPSDLQRLLAILLVHRGQPHSREALGHLLWPGTQLEQRRKGLRQALWKLHQVGIGRQGGTLDVDDGYVTLNSGDGLWLDVAAFEAAYAEARGVESTALPDNVADRLTQAAGLYRGELLQGWDEPWCLAERWRLAAVNIMMLDRLCNHCIETRHMEAGLTHVRRILAQEPARERSHRQLMLLLALTGDREKALEQFHQCVEALRTTFDLPPEGSTVALYESIRSGGDVLVPLPPEDDRGAWKNQSQRLAGDVAALIDRLNRLGPLNPADTDGNAT